MYYRQTIGLSTFFFFNLKRETKKLKYFFVIHIAFFFLPPVKKWNCQLWKISWRMEKLLRIYAAAHIFKSSGKIQNIFLTEASHVQFIFLLFQFIKQSMKGLLTEFDYIAFAYWST